MLDLEGKMEIFFFVFFDWYTQVLYVHRYEKKN